MAFHAILRRRRIELHITQPALGDAIGIDVRQIKRYEAGDAQPTLATAIAIAHALRISLNELAGFPDQPVDLGGRWWASWQVLKDGKEMVVGQGIDFEHHGNTIYLDGLSGGLAADAYGLWSGELELTDKNVLLGWYDARFGVGRTKGTLYLVLDPARQEITGRWVGLGFDSTCETGWAVASRNEFDARVAIDQLRRREVPGG